MDARHYSPLHRLSRAILARGSEKLRGTDWWAVFVEIAIVVLGILIAFQLDSWGERREQRRAERLLWQRLAEETRNDIAVLDNVLGQHLESAENYRLLADAVANPGRQVDFDGRGRATCNLLRLPAVQRQSSGAIGQAAGSRLELISDPELRKLLRQADANRIFSDRQLDFFRANFLRYGDNIEPHMLWRFIDNGRTACRVNVDALRADSKAVALLPKLYRDQRQFARYRAYEVQSLRAVEKRVLELINSQS
ncbi:hypothetical protein G7076_00295 [Sphingomonas sp. HDW15A]|uniref:hypothetical protein n=1 Tax=Sphingomonas sp. HDW15A TaxID=2714942 RepID=UPI00140CF442|nr:hypothetical protein [Sphingomonas sp. HDW15A]QIK95132.1 hypothetical protein G7076_00295 [Sphingomonas sp. HDW15A]